ncbi:glutamine amidotransferase, partial [Streptomyces anulatus]
MSNNGLRLVWVYPDLLSTYGDQGNAQVGDPRGPPPAQGETRRA